MDFWFTLKKLLSLYINPVAITLELLFLGIVLIGLASRRPRKPLAPRRARLRAFLGDFGIFLVILGILTLFLASIDPVGGALALSLEKQHPPLAEQEGRFVVERQPAYIVVLAGGHLAAPEKPVLSRLTRHALSRTVGAVDLWKAFPSSRLVFTGHPDETGAMRDIAVRVGVPAASVLEENESRDTKDHPLKLAPILGDSPFLLVTSAMHMPRAVALFKGKGLDPTPAPVDFLVWPDANAYDPYHEGLFVPRVFNLELTSTALHEIAGLAWSRWRGEAGR